MPPAGHTCCGLLDALMMPIDQTVMKPGVWWQGWGWGAHYTVKPDMECTLGPWVWPLASSDVDISVGEPVVDGN